MKNIFLFILCIALSFSVFAQRGVTYYYGSQWDEISDNNSTIYKVKNQTFMDKMFGLDYNFSTGESFYETGNLAAGKNDSVWTGYYPDGSLYYRETYKNGKLIHGTSISVYDKKYDYEKEYVPPKPKGGGFEQFKLYNQDYWRTILSALKKKYPEHYAKLQETQREVSTAFWVNINGSVQVVEVSGGKDFGYNIKLA